MLYHTRNFIQYFLLAFILLTKSDFISNIGSSHHIPKIRSQQYPKIFPFVVFAKYIIYLIFHFVWKFKCHTPILFEVGLHSWRKSLFQDRSDFRRDLRFPFHYFIFIYFRCLISNIYLLSVYNESSQGSLVSISCYFLYLL